MVNVAVLGYGTVGSGVVEVIGKNNETIGKKSGQELRVKYILDLRDFPGDPYEDRIIHDFNVIAQDPEVQIVCETMGGTGAAYQFTKTLLGAGKSVCTSNKELVAKHGPELLAIARAHNANYLFEASVGGGIPIIRPLNASLTAERIEAITGILNGTTNYILTAMERDGADFAEVLAKAQELGYAERNPEADVEGHDACRKIAILSSLMMGQNVDAERIYTEGITHIAPSDFAFAHELGKTIKLLGLSRLQEDGSVLAMVAPFLVDRAHPLAMVNDVFNAVFVTGNMLGDSMYYGRGAGKLPTASAVVSDVIDCARHLGKSIMCFWDEQDAPMADVAQTSWQYYIRAKQTDAAKLRGIFPGSTGLKTQDPSQCGILTKPLTEADFRSRMEQAGNAAENYLRLY